MVLSAEPVANHSLEESKDMALTHPRWPDITAESSQGACHVGTSISGVGFLATILLVSDKIFDFVGSFEVTI